jgi:hypothetical protein
MDLSTIKTTVETFAVNKGFDILGAVIILTVGAYVAR